MISPTAQLHLLVFILALTGVLGRLLTLNATSLVIWRTAIATLIMGLWLLWRKKAPILLAPALVFQLLGVGVVIGAHWILFYASIKVSNLSICLTGMAAISLFTAFTEPWMNGTKIRKQEVLLGLLVACGLALVAGVESDHHLGLLLAVASAFLAAIFPVFNRKFVLRGTAPETILFWEMPGALLAALLVHGFLTPYQTLLEWQPLDYLWMFILAVLCTVFAHSFHTHLLRKITAYTSNLAINFEPVYGIILGAMLFQDHHNLQPAFYLGACTIFLANFLHIRTNR